MIGPPSSNEKDEKSGAFWLKCISYIFLLNGLFPNAVIDCQSPFVFQYFYNQSWQRLVLKSDQKILDVLYFKIKEFLSECAGIIKGMSGYCCHVLLLLVLTPFV